jgi:hypothetical protein
LILEYLLYIRKAVDHFPFWEDPPLKEEQGVIVLLVLQKPF